MLSTVHCLRGNDEVKCYVYMITFVACLTLFLLRNVLPRFLGETCSMCVFCHQLRHGTDYAPSVARVFRSTQAQKQTIPVRRRHSQRRRIPKTDQPLSLRHLFIIVRLSYSKWLAFFVPCFPNFLSLMMDGFLPLSYLNSAKPGSNKRFFASFNMFLPRFSPVLAPLNRSTPARRV